MFQISKNCFIHPIPAKYVTYPFNAVNGYRTTSPIYSHIRTRNEKTSSRGQNVNDLSQLSTEDKQRQCWLFPPGDFNWLCAVGTTFTYLWLQRSSQAQQTSIPTCYLPTSQQSPLPKYFQLTCVNSILQRSIPDASYRTSCQRG